MAENPDVTGGTVSVTAGTKIVTGVGTMWSTYGLLPGDMFGSDGYPTARIEIIDDNGTSITLKDNWRGPTLTDSASYFIRYQADSSRYSALLGAVRKMITQPILTAFSGLTGAADTIAYFTGASTMATVAFKAWARSFIGAADIDAARVALGAGALSDVRGENAVMNADFSVWARQPSFSVTNPANLGFITDRWRSLYNGTGATRTCSRQRHAAGQTDVPGNPQFYLRWSQTVAGTTGTFNLIQHRIEDVSTYAGNKVTLTCNGPINIRTGSPT